MDLEFAIRENFLIVIDTKFLLGYDAALSLGAIAQLGERYNGIVEVGGSIPPGSTKRVSSSTTIPGPKRIASTLYVPFV